MLCISVSFQVLTCLLIIATLCPSITALLNIVKISEQFINTRRHVNSQYLFGFFNKNKDEKAKLENIKSSVTNAAPKATGKVEASKLSQMKGQLEKISNTQNRDYEAEAIKNAPRPKEIQDKQVQSFNFNKANEFPNLYKGWIKSDGDQIAKQMIASTKQALKTAKLIEVLFDPVPNLDEVAFGTVWNKKFRGEVSANLKVPDYATNRGGPSTLEWSNIYWANRLVEGLGAKNVVVISLSGEGTRGQNLPILRPGMKLYTLADAKKNIEAIKSTGACGLVIVLSPCQESHYNDARVIGEKLGASVVALNSPYSFRYDIGAGGLWTLAYVMKRVPKGWIYRSFPREFEVIIEGPNYEVFKATSYKVQPSLQVISRISMEASMQKYGAVGNDRIFEQRL